MHNKLYKTRNVMAGKAKEGTPYLVNFASWSSKVCVEWTKD
jgi:hypothetical protein